MPEKTPEKHEKTEKKRFFDEWRILKKHFHGNPACFVSIMKQIVLL